MIIYVYTLNSTSPHENFMSKDSLQLTCLSIFIFITILVVPFAICSEFIAITIRLPRPPGHIFSKNYYFLLKKYTRTCFITIYIVVIYLYSVFLKEN